MKHLKVGCFRSDEPIAGSVLETLRTFSGEPNKADGSRTRMVGDVPIILRHVEAHNNGESHLLDFARVRGVKVLTLSDLKGKEGEITFDETDMRPTERAAAILDLPSRCLLIQENGSGISHGTIAKYLRLLVDDYPPIRFKLVMDGAAQARLTKSRGFTKLSVGLAKLGNVDDLASYGFGDHEILRFARGMGATKLGITYSIDTASDEASLNSNQVIEIASSLITLPKQYLRSLSVTPTEVGEDELAINMVKDKIVVRHPITEPEAQGLPDAVRYRAVTTAWRKYRDLLRTRYYPSQE